MRCWFSIMCSCPAERLCQFFDLKEGWPRDRRIGHRRASHGSKGSISAKIGGEIEKPGHGMLNPFDLEGGFTALVWMQSL